MGRDTIAGLIAGIIQRNSISNEIIQNSAKRVTREAFVDSETDTDFTEVTLSPKENCVLPNSRPPSAVSRKQSILFQKRQNASSPANSASGSTANHQQFHSLPQTSINKTSSNFGQVSSWEANNLMEEMTTKNSQIFSKNLQILQNGANPSMITMELDSLSNRYPLLSNGPLLSNDSNHDEDSLNFDLQEAGEEEPEQDSLTGSNENHYYEHDSLQPIKPVIKEKKKLIIPYNESFSSSNSIFTTSQDGSLDSNCANHRNNQTEDDSLTHSNPANMTLNMKPWRPEYNNHLQNDHPRILGTADFQNPRILGPEYQNSGILAPQYQNPKILGPEYQPGLPGSNPVNIMPQPMAQATAPMAVPQASPSLMKMATERMKKKFMGWS